MDKYEITLPVIQSCSYSANPVATGASLLVTVAATEQTIIRYPEERYAGEFMTGEN